MWQAIMALAILITIVQPGNVYGQNGSGSLMDMTQMSSTTLGDFQSLDVSDDGQTIALISTSFGTLSYDRQHQSVLRQIPRVDIAMALTSDGQRIVLSNDRVLSHSPVNAFSYETSTGLFFDGSSSFPSQIVTISPEAPEVVAGYTDGQMGFHKWDANKGYWSSRYWQGHNTSINHLVYDESRELLISSDSNRNVKAFSLDGELQWEASQFAEPVAAIAISPEVVGVGVANQLYFLDISNGQELTSIQHNHGTVSSIGFLNGFFVTGGYDGYLRWWSPGGGNLTQELLLLDGQVQALAIARSTGEILAGSSDGIIYIISTNATVSDELHLDAFFYGDIDIELLPDETQLVVTTIDGTLGLWSLTDQSWIFFEKVEAFPRLMTISDDGRWVVIAYAEKMTIWEFNEQPILKTEVPICKSPSLVRFLPNNSQLVVSTAFGHTSIWNIETAQTGLSLLGSEDACNGLIEQYPQERMLTLTSNDEWLVTGHANGNIRFWSLEDFSQLDELNFDVMGPVFNLHIYGEQLLERNGQFEDQIDFYDFALSAWSLTADHERLWHYPLNHQALFDFPPSSDLLAQGFLEGVFSIVTLESLASGTPSGVRYEIDGQVSEIEMVGKTIALVIDNEIQLWQADSE